MPKKQSEPTELPKERAFLVGIEIRSENNLLTMEDSLSELSLLADTAGLEVTGEAMQRLEHPHPNTLIGSGKIEEIRAFVEETESDIIIFDYELSPRHQRELEEVFGQAIRVIDRSALILDIFAQHAQTREGILQVELAQYEYRLPRLTRAWTHLARQTGGGGGRTGSQGGVGLRGPGETQLEIDRQEIRRKITILKSELVKVREHRKRHRSQRKRSQIPIATLVGYTNSGKSTLLNCLAKTNIYTANQLFATLDPTTRRVRLPSGENVLFTDTVGFIQKLPTQLIAAFRATLEEIASSDLLVHLIDISHPNALAQKQAVLDTLKEIGADHIPILTVLNKIDLLDQEMDLKKIALDFPDSIAISAKKGTSVSDLVISMEKILYRTYIPISVRLSYKNGQLISLFHTQGQVEVIEHGRGNVFISGKIPARLLASFSPYIQSEEP